MLDVLLQSRSPAFSNLPTETWVLLCLLQPKLQIRKLQLVPNELYDGLDRSRSGPRLDGLSKDFDLLDDVARIAQGFGLLQNFGMGLIGDALLLELV